MAAIGKEYPTLERIATKLFAMSATSADVERFFFLTGGDVCTPDRSRLEPETINKLRTCNVFLRRELGIVDKRNVASESRALRFAFLNAELEAESPTDFDALYDAMDELAPDDVMGNVDD